MRLFTALPLLGAMASALAAQSAAPAAPALPTILGCAVSGSATLGSQYIFRGLTQTDGKPTVQGEVDLVHPSGFYLSTSMSNISWYTDQNSGFVNTPVSLGAPGPGGAPYFPDKTNSTSVELDLFGGYKWSFAKDWTLDLGLYRYLYPGTYANLGLFRNPATTEAYLGLSYSWASLKYSQVLSATTFGTANAKGTSYVDLSLSIPLGESGFTFLAHGGRTTYAAHSNDLFYNGTTKFDDNSVFSYTDYRVGLAKEVSGYTFTLAGSGANSKDAAADGQTPVYINVMGRNIGGSRVAFTIAKAF